MGLRFCARKPARAKEAGDRKGPLSSGSQRSGEKSVKEKRRRRRKREDQRPPSLSLSLTPPLLGLSSAKTNRRRRPLFSLFHLLRHVPPGDHHAQHHHAQGLVQDRDRVLRVRGQQVKRKELRKRREISLSPFRIEHDEGRARRVAGFRLASFWLCGVDPSLRRDDTQRERERACT